MLPPPGRISWLNFERKGVTPTYSLTQYPGRVLFDLVFCTDISLGHDILIGTLMTVAYDKILNGVVYSCSQPIISEGEALGVQRRALMGESITTPTEPRILVFSISLCGFQAPAPATVQVC